MAAVVDDIAATTGNRVDLLLATHEHWDHLSGFKQAEENLEEDRLRRGLARLDRRPEGRVRAAARREAVARRSRRCGSPNPGCAWPARRTAPTRSAACSTFSARAAMRQKRLSTVVRSLTAGARAIAGPAMTRSRFDGVGRAFLCSRPAARLEAAGEAVALQTRSGDLRADRHDVSRRPAERDPVPRGGARRAVRPASDDPDGARQGAGFLQATLLGSRAPPSPRRRRSLARHRYGLVRGSARARPCSSTARPTIRASFVAIELADQDVLLFAADAQIGNWLSWQDLHWKLGDRTVTGPDLLKRTVLYKVGHHGSHNATLREKGLELMQKLSVALLPVDERLAKQKRWARIPLPASSRHWRRKPVSGWYESDRQAPDGMRQSRPHRALLRAHPLIAEIARMTGIGRARAAGADRPALSLAGAVFSAAAVDRAEDQPGARASSACRPTRRCSPNDGERLRMAWDAGEFCADRRRRSLSARLSRLARQCGVGDIAVPSARLPDRLRDCPGRAGRGGSCFVSCHAAVLDELSDPRLCLDRHPEAERAAERVSDRIWG